MRAGHRTDVRLSPVSGAINELAETDTLAPCAPEQFIEAVLPEEAIASALLPLRTLQAMYELATAEKHSFWFINLLNEREEMFFKNFDHRMVPSAGRMLPNSKGHEPLPTGQAAPQLPVPRAGAGA